MHLGVPYAQLTQHGFEIIPTVAVEHQQFVNSLAVEYLHDVVEHGLSLIHI